MRNQILGTMAVVILLLSASLYGEEVIVNLLPYDGNAATFVNNQIVADTTAAGGLSTNRVYELERDAYYLQNATLTIPNKKVLHMRAKGGSGSKPVLYLWESGTGATPTRPPGNFVVLNGGDLRMEEVCVAGFYEPEASRVSGVQGGLVNTTAVGSSILLDGVIFSNINGQLVRTGFNSAKVQVINSIFANMGALPASNFGAGKGFDLREAACDSFILVNNTFVNYQDRAVRHYNVSKPDVGTGEIKYGRIEHNTFVNGMGFHGLLSLGNVGPEMTVSNNLFVDGFALGEDSTDATRSAEWGNTGEKYPNGKNRITWIFTAPNTTTQWAVSKNFYAVSDSGKAFLNDFNFPVGSPLSYHINSRLGADSVKAFTREDGVQLVKIPRLMTNTMRWYEWPNPIGAGKKKEQTYFVPARDDYDRRVIEFYRDSLDASYATTAAAYKGAEDGYPAGDLNWFPSLKTSWLYGEIITDVEVANVVPELFRLNQNYPNPFNPTTQISFSLNKAGFTTLTVYNVLGQKVATPLEGKLPAGQHEIRFDASNLANGVYFYILESDNQVSQKKMLLVK